MMAREGKSDWSECICGQITRRYYDGYGYFSAQLFSVASRILDQLDHREYRCITWQTHSRFRFLAIRRTGIRQVPVAKMQKCMD